MSISANAYEAIMRENVELKAKLAALAAENERLRNGLADALDEYDRVRHICNSACGYVSDSDEIHAARALLNNKEQGDA